MFKRFSVLALMVVGLFSCQSWADPRKDIESNYLKMNQAMQMKFVEGVFSLRARDFKAYGSGGKLLNIQSERKELAQLLARSLSVTATTTVERVVLKGKRAVVEVSEEATFLVAATPRAVPHPIIVRSESTDVWVLLPGGWRLSTTSLKSQEFPDSLH